MLNKNNETFDVEVLLNNAVLFKADEVYEPNILELAKVNNKELPVSNLYAYFFTPSESHGLGGLFLKSLLELRNFGVSFHDYKKVRVHREIKTDDGKYIDLIIKDDENRIVIENKLYADIYNKLDSYESHNRLNCNECIILSVVNLPEKVGNFYTITHQNLFESVERNFKSENISLTERQKVNFESFIEILKSHYQIVENLAEKIEFISMNSDKITKLVQLLNEVHTSYINKVKIVAKELFKGHVKFTVQKGNSITFKVNDLSLYGYIFFSDNDISKLVLNIWIADNKSWVEEWHKDGHGRFSGVLSKYSTLLVPDTKGDSAIWASMVFKMYDLNIENFEKFEEEFRVSVQNEWVPFLKDLKDLN
ncbi:PD-(D/E)XK nuclease family protein [Emticicia sp. 21SJ11W-3]|uniref:PDDEXK-like family protein n=1 Tax=Emticicia sp. 21SJ11W-3 TaxID=2916755 RepID=UPI00209DB64A|nr:PD-(D/E)XK nuclease family protein [Emticicia sp. 21SJ11W-3]UTA66516.1 PD-(D/E)XK nuclease family protein [Emticicia sp. 21SJ11W-3]